LPTRSTSQVCGHRRLPTAIDCSRLAARIERLRVMAQLYAGKRPISKGIGGVIRRFGVFCLSRPSVLDVSGDLRNQGVRTCHCLGPRSSAALLRTVSAFSVDFGCGIVDDRDRIAVAWAVLPVFGDVDGVASARSFDGGPFEVASSTSDTWKRVTLVLTRAQLALRRRKAGISRTFSSIELRTGEKRP
jgi:hypothetical protein